MTNTKPKRKTRDPNVYPPGLDAARAKAIADYYDARKDEVLPENGDEDSGVVWVEVPRKVVPQILKLIANLKKLA